jgi:hypothetical protein
MLWQGATAGRAAMLTGDDSAIRPSQSRTTSITVVGRLAVHPRLAFFRAGAVESVSGRGGTGED